MKDAIRTIREALESALRESGNGPVVIKLVDCLNILALLPALEQPAPTDEARQARIDEIFDPKKYNRRECFADSEDGLHASICYNDMIVALQHQPEAVGDEARDSAFKAFSQWYNDKGHQHMRKHTADAVLWVLAAKGEKTKGKQK